VHACVSASLRFWSCLSLILFFSLRRFTLSLYCWRVFCLLPRADLFNLAYAVLFAITLAVIVYPFIEKHWRIHVALRAQPAQRSQIIPGEALRFRFAAVSNSTYLLSFGFELTLVYALRALYCIDGGAGKLVLSMDTRVV